MTFPSRQASARRVHIMVYMVKVKEARGYRSSDREIGIFRVRLRAARKRGRYARFRASEKENVHYRYYTNVRES